MVLRSCCRIQRQRLEQRTCRVSLLERCDIRLAFCLKGIRMWLVCFICTVRNIRLEEEAQPLCDYLQPSPQHAVVQFFRFGEWRAKKLLLVSHLYVLESSFAVSDDAQTVVMLDATNSTQRLYRSDVVTGSGTYLSTPDLPSGSISSITLTATHA